MNTGNANNNTISTPWTIGNDDIYDNNIGNVGLITGTTILEEIHVGGGGLLTGSDYDHLTL